MKYSQRQEEQDTFDAYELKKVMRGNVMRIAEAVEPFTFADWRLQKGQHYSTIARAVAGKPSWMVTVSALGELHADAYERPEKYCFPPDIPDTIEDFRKVALEYATNTWWFETLNLSDLLKASSFQTAMSRGNPRSWPEIHARAVRWRQACIDGLEQHRLQRREIEISRAMQHTWLKDFIDHNKAAIESDRQVLLDECVRVFKLKERYYDRVMFDPANPTSGAYVFCVVDEWEQGVITVKAKKELNEITASGFEHYRTTLPPNGERYEETVRRQDQFMGLGGYTEWLQTYEIRREMVWAEDAREYEEISSRLHRVLARRPVSDAIAGEQLGGYYTTITRQDKTQPLPEGFKVRKRTNFGTGTSFHYKISGVQNFVERWRPATPDDKLLDREWILQNRANPDDLSQMPQMPRQIEQEIEWGDLVEPEQYTVN